LEASKRKENEEIMFKLKTKTFLLILIFLTLGFLTAADNEWTTYGPKGGLIRAVTYDPNNIDVVYISVLKGGVYRSLDGGKKWELLLSEESIESNAYDIAVDYFNSDIIYVAAYSEVFKTMDNGATWQSVSPDFRLGVCTDIVIDPTNSNIIFLATEVGILKSTDAGTNWNTINTGLTHLYISCLAICPAAPNALYAGSWVAPIVYKTTNAGASWSTVFSGSTGEHIRTVAVNPLNPNIVYTSEYERGGILKSTNGGNTWNLTEFYEYFGEMMDANVIIVNPINPNIVYSGRNVGRFSKSIDSGAHWREKINGFTSLGDIYAIAVNSFENGKILVGTMASIFKSRNGGESWSEENTGLNKTHIEDLAIDPQNPEMIYAGTHGGSLYKSSNFGKSWSASNNGIWGHSICKIAIHPVSTNILYVGDIFGQIYKSENKGLNWSMVFTKNSGTYGAPASIIIDPKETDVVYAGLRRYGIAGFSHRESHGIIKSFDSGAKWKAFNSGLTNLDVHTLAIDPSNTMRLYAGTAGGGVFKTVNGADTWTSCNRGITDLDINILAVDHNNPDTIYAGTDGGGIFKSTDKGDTWTPINGGIKNKFIRSIAVDKINGDKIYAGTLEYNFYYSINGGDYWEELIQGLPLNIESVEDIAISPSNSEKLYVATFGGGVYEREIVIPVVTGSVNIKGTGLPKVTLYFSNNVGTAVTDQNGRYSRFVFYDWSGTVTPQKDGYLFIPANSTYASIVSDQNGGHHTAYHDNTSLSISVSREADSAWIIRRQYGKIDIVIKNPDNIPFKKYAIYRKKDDEPFYQVNEFGDSQIRENVYTYTDRFIDQDKSYIYKFAALDSNGAIITESDEVAI
jgi:photosystem II stability/assembly factor-like uncharacterized protein